MKEFFTMNINVIRNELHVSKLITEMPKLNMSHNARLVLYSVLKKSWKTFRNRKDYISSEILTVEDYEIAKQPITLKLTDLKSLFSKNASYKGIKEHILTIPYEATFKTYYDSFGEKKDYLMDTKIALFKKVQFDDKNKEIIFTPEEYLLNYIEALKTFAKIDIEEMKKLTSSNYAMRAYEFICQKNYLDKNNNKLVSDEVRKIRVEDFRRYFEVPNSYNAGRIDQRVFAPIKKLINKYTKYNIVSIKKFKLDPRDKKKVSHYRIDIEYKEEYLKEMKEKASIKVTESNDNIKNSLQNFFDVVWSLYPIRKGKADITKKDMEKLYEYGYETIKTCINRYLEYIEEKKKEGFNQALQNGYKFFTKGYVDYLDENYTKYTAKFNNIKKPSQSNNFTQREYDDDFFESLYDNFK
jgi:hypothetical protein